MMNGNMDYQDSIDKWDSENLQSQLEACRKDLAGWNAILTGGPESLKRMIEAYEQTRSGMNAAYEKSQQDLKVALEALEFYGNERTYNIRHIAIHVDGIHAGISSDVHFDGGKKARQTIAKITRTT